MNSSTSFRLIILTTLSVFSFSANDILLPSSSINNNNSTNNDTSDEPSKKPIAIGSTWTNAGNINIDFDNLVGKKTAKGPAPSMNQLKSANTSPVKSQVSPAGLKSPMGNNSNFMFTQSTASNNNNNNFNQFNAFQ